MKNIRFPFLIMGLLALMIIGYTFWQCTGNPDAYRIITLTGSTFGNNLSRTHFSFGSIAESGDTTAMLVSEGDLLYLFSKSENPLVFRYSESDGEHLNIETDSSTLYRADMNGKMHSLYFYDEDDATDWKDNKDLEALSDLRAIHITGSALTDNFEIIEEIAGINPGVGLLIDDIDDPEFFDRILSLFQPAWLFLPEVDENMLDESLMGFGLGDLKFVVVSTDPKQAVLITEQTEVKFNPEATESLYVVFSSNSR